MIKDFEKLAHKHDHNIKFILLVWAKNSVSSGIKHELGIYSEKRLPTLRILTFGEYKHLAKRRERRKKDKNKKKPKIDPNDKNARRKQMERLNKLFSSDTPHPAHNNTVRETKKYSSDDVTKQGMEKFLMDFHSGTVTDYLKADYLPKDNHKRHVRTLNSYNYVEFLEETKKNNKIAVIWVYPHSSHKYKEYYEHYTHLAKHPSISKSFSFGNIDMSKNERPHGFSGQKSMNKMYLYRNETDTDKIWKETVADDLARLFKYFMAVAFEKNSDPSIDNDL